MPVGMLGNKVGMTQVFMDDGDANPVTIIKVGPCIVTQIKTVSNALPTVFLDIFLAFL